MPFWQEAGLAGAGGRGSAPSSDGRGPVRAASGSSPNLRGADGDAPLPTLPSPRASDAGGGGQTGSAAAAIACSEEARGRGGGGDAATELLEALDARMDGLDKKLERIAQTVGARIGPGVRANLNLQRGQFPVKRIAPEGSGPIVRFDVLLLSFKLFI